MKTIVVLAALITLVVAASAQYPWPTRTGTSNTDGGTSQTGQTVQTVPTVNTASGGLLGLADLISLILGNLNVLAPIQVPLNIALLSAGGTSGAAMGPGAGGLTGTGGTTGSTGTTGGKPGGTTGGKPGGTTGGKPGGPTGVVGSGGPLGGLTSILGLLAPILGLLSILGLGGGGGGGILGLGGSGGRIAVPNVARCNSNLRTGREAFHEDGFKFPGHTTEFEVETDDGLEKVVQTTYGRQIGQTVVVHSVLIGNGSALHEFVASKPDTRSGHPEAIDATLAEFNLKSLTNLATNMIVSKSKAPETLAMSECQIKGMECFLESRGNVIVGRDCSELLIECLKR